MGEVEDYEVKVLALVWNRAFRLHEIKLDQLQGRAPEPGMGIRTLLDAILLNFTLRLLVCDALDAVVEVVLGRGALLGVFALCLVHLLAPRSSGNIEVHPSSASPKHPEEAAQAIGVPGWLCDRVS